MEKKYELIAPCHFGLEAVLKREIQDLGYEISQVEDGKVTFFGDEEAIARANIFLRTTERVLLKVGKIKAETFDELFEKTKAQLGDTARCDEDVLSYIAFPQLAEKFFEKRREAEENKAVYTIEEA